jgi:hypothetical protein
LPNKASHPANLNLWQSVPHLKCIAFSLLYPTLQLQKNAQQILVFCTSGGPLTHVPSHAKSVQPILTPLVWVKMALLNKASVCVCTHMGIHIYIYIYYCVLVVCQCIGRRKRFGEICCLYLLSSLRYSPMFVCRCKTPDYVASHEIPHTLVDSKERLWPCQWLHRGKVKRSRVYDHYVMYSNQKCTRLGYSWLCVRMDSSFEYFLSQLCKILTFSLL